MSYRNKAGILRSGVCNDCMEQMRCKTSAGDKYEHLCGELEDHEGKHVCAICTRRRETAEKEKNI